MTHFCAFNGDADGICALQQLQLGEPGDVTLVTGVKRDIELLERVPATSGDRCTVLDVSLDVNRAGLMSLLERGVTVRYFDHHYAGEIPAHPAFEAHLDPSPEVCTSLLVDRALQGRHRLWALVGVFGDSLTAQGLALATELDLDRQTTDELKMLGVCIKYNAYGETVEDLRVAPQHLARQVLPFADPRDFIRNSPIYRELADGFREDMERAGGLEPLERAPGAIVFVLPDQAWARRVSGTLANDLAKAHAGNAIALLSPKSSGGYLVSVRVPAGSRLMADAFCRQYKTGGGRSTAAGINDLPAASLDGFTRHFAQEFQRV